MHDSVGMHELGRNKIWTYKQTIDMYQAVAFDVRNKDINIWRSGAIEGNKQSSTKAVQCKSPKDNVYVRQSPMM